MIRAYIVGFLFVATAAGATLIGRAPDGRTSLSFEVAVGPGLLPRATDGRVLVVLGKRARPEPRSTIGETDNDSPPVLGADGKRLSTGSKVVLDHKCALFPLEHLSRLPRGDYHVQAVFDHNPDIRLASAPGNLVSEVMAVTLDPARGGTISIKLTRRLPNEQLPSDTKDVKYLKFRSEKLSRFYGRPMYLRAGIILPPGHAADKHLRYPLRVRIGGFGTRYSAVGGMMSAFSTFRGAWGAKGAPRMIVLHLDGTGPLGDPYQVNSANHGPYGDAITQELIPHVEKTYRAIGQPYARVLDGASTGGWVSLALQVFYPDFFNGCWSHCPDPVDFRAYELIDLYRDANAFINRHGNERPSSRDLNGDVRTTVRQEVRLERVLGRGDNWALSGKDWASWNATFGARGQDGLPVPVWDGVTGKINRDAVRHWEKYDLRAVLAKNWAQLGPKLRGKINIWVGDADEYFLNNAVHLLDDFLKTARPAYEGKITFGARKGHDWRGLSPRQLMDEMAKAVERGRKAAGM